MTDRSQLAKLQPVPPDEDSAARGAPRRVARRRLVKAATATVAAVIAASGYVRPSVRPLQVPVAHAFSF